MSCRYAVLLAILAVQVSLVPASATLPGQSGEARIADCIKRAAAGRTWLEKTLWGLRDQEGGWIGARVANSNGTFDLGPLQINCWWVPRIAALAGRTEAEISKLLRYDACFNADAARWIFLAALDASGDYWQAIGLYHSPTPWRQQRYALRVAGHLTRRFGEGVFRSPASRPVQ
jgi:hypothetical protein